MSLEITSAEESAETPPSSTGSAAGAEVQTVVDSAVAVTPPTGDPAVPAPDSTGPPGQSQRSLESNPKGPPPNADRGSSADNGGQSPHAQPG